MTQLEGKDNVFMRDSTVQLITAYEAKEAEVDRIHKA